AWYAKGAPVLPLALAAESWIAFLVYAYWFSTFGGRDPSMKLVVGSALPEFQVKNISGEAVSPRQFIGKPTIFIFYRGNWCPFCMAQLKELAARYEEIRQLGVRVAMISPQPHGNTVEIARKFRIDLTFEFFTDEGNAAARSLGILNLHGTPMGMQALGYDSDTVLPTVIITDRDGRIVWVHETDNYRIRPEPEVYLEVLRRNGLAPAVL
ncbi:MAG TPA: peroxiredoxin-like family protein, partial [Gallionellaceae bacterium]